MFLLSVGKRHYLAVVSLDLEYCAQLGDLQYNTNQTVGESPLDGQVAGAHTVGEEAEGPGLCQPGEDKARGGTLTAAFQDLQVVIKTKEPARFFSGA